MKFLRALHSLEDLSIKAILIITISFLSVKLYEKDKIASTNAKHAKKYRFIKKNLIYIKRLIKF